MAAATLLSCEDGLKDHLTENKVYLVSSGLQEFEIYKTGEAASYRLAVYKSGVGGGACTASVSVCSAEELADWNEQNETGYRMLDETCYAISSSTVEFAAGQKEVNGVVEITFRPEAIEALGEGGYVLPVKLSGATVGINPDKAIAVLRPTVIEPLVYFASSGASLEFGLGDADVVQKLTVAFNATNKDNIECHLAVYEAYLESYNKAHGTAFQLLPETSYTLPETVTIAQGSNEATAKLALAVSGLPLGSYLLPVRLACGQFDVRKGDDLYILEIVVTNPVLDPKKWTLTANTDEPAESAPNGRVEAIVDGDINTFWHSQWSGGWQDWPHVIIIDMNERCEVLSIDYYGRQSGGDANAKDMEFFISEDGNDWASIGKFEAKKTTALQMFDTEDCEGRYLKLEITSSHDGSNNTNIGELIVHGTVLK